MDSIYQKNQTTLYLISQLMAQKNIDNIQNRKLMRLLYLIYIEYAYRCRQHKILHTSPMAQYQFYAWQLGPVEKETYANWDNIRAMYATGKIPTFTECGFSPDEMLSVHGAIEYVRNNYANCDLDYLIQMLTGWGTKWKQTPLANKMLFLSPGDVKNEIDKIHSAKYRIKQRRR